MSKATAGIDLLLKVGDGEELEEFNTIAGLRAKSLSINSESIDVTNHGSGEWREILGGKGLRSVDVSGDGVFVDDSEGSDTVSRLRTQMMNNALTNFEIEDVKTGDTFSGAFKISSLEYAGDYNGEKTWSISLESSGAVTFTAGV